MKILRSLLVFPITVILLLTAFDLAASGLWGLPQHPVLSLLNRRGVSPAVMARYGRIFWAAAGVLAAAVWVLTVLIWRRRSRPLQVRSLSGERMLIHPGALLKFVRLQVESHPAVTAQRARVRQRSTGGLGVWVMAVVRPIDALPNIKRQLEEKIRTGLTQVLGIERIDELTLVISLDEKSLNWRPGPAGAPEPKPEPPVRGAVDEEDAPETEADHLTTHNSQPTTPQPTPDEEESQHERKDI